MEFRRIPCKPRGGRRLNDWLESHEAVKSQNVHEVKRLLESSKAKAMKEKIAELTILAEEQGLKHGKLQLTKSGIVSG